MEKQSLLYSGKAKSVYRTEDPQRLVLAFRDDASAFDGQRVAQLERKGRVNNLFNAFIMEKLEGAGVPTHFVRVLDETTSLVKALTMLPVECVVRNFAAGSLCRRLGVTEGLALDPPIFELFLKDDALGDPLINEHHASAFGWASEADLATMKALTFEVNEVLKPLFAAGGLQLVDYKLEFGHFAGELMLGDEFTPDGCRLWDSASGESLDKDRFRQQLGGVIEGYEEVARRLGIEV